MPASRPAILLAARFLFPFDSNAQTDDPNWPRAGRWFLGWGLLLGVAYMLIFRGTWRVFGEYQGIRWMPVMAVLTADFAFGGYRLVAGAAQTIRRLPANEHDAPSSAGTAGTVLIALVVIMKFALLVSMPLGAWKMSPTGAAGWESQLSRLGWLYPRPVYHPLVLMPLWGRWAMLLALTIGRAAPHGSNRLRQLVDGARLARVIIAWLVCTALTTLYCAPSVEHLGRGIVVSVGVFLAGYLTSFFLARRAGGQTEDTIGAAGLAGELGFLLIHLAVVSAIYWY